jgi:parallel beta-helix repeat protein
VFVIDSSATKILSNDTSRSGIVGMFMAGPIPANAKVVDNNISGDPWGIYVTDSHRGSSSGSTIRDNCAGMYFESNPSSPAGGLEVKANTVEDNTITATRSKKRTPPPSGQSCSPQPTPSGCA